MAAFAYEAINAKGKNTKGVLEGDNARQIRQQLRDKGLIPLNVEQVAELRQRVLAGEQKSALAREFGISRETLYRYAAG